MPPGVELRGQHINKEAFRVVLKEHLHLAYGNGTYLLHAAILFFLQDMARASSPQ